MFGSGLGHASSSLPAAVFLMGALSVALANAVNNQPMTILLTRVALAPRWEEGRAARELNGGGGKAYFVPLPRWKGQDTWAQR